MVEIEKWKDIKGYEGYYQVSNLGNIRSLDREIVKKDGTTQIIKGGIVNKILNRDGYYVVSLNMNGENKSKRVNRLVAESFIDNPDNLPEINHIDFNRINNKVDNLEWCTHKDNVRYSKQAGHYYMLEGRYGELNPNYGNHKLSEFYKNNPEISKIKNSRKGKQNGRCIPVRVIKDDMVEEFDYIGEAVKFLKDLDLTHNKDDVVRNRIRKSMIDGTKYLGYTFEQINKED